MKTDYRKLIEALEYAIFGSPERAMGFGGWTMHGREMRTRLRPDSSDGRESNKSVLRYYFNKNTGDNHLHFYYNGDTFVEYNKKRVIDILAEKYGERDWMRTVCKMYGIRREDFPDTSNDSTFTPRDFKQTYNKPKPYTIGDESKVDCIPQTIVSMTYDRTRPDVLRDFLCRTFGESATLQAWEKYRVGDGFGGQTLFWYYDRWGRCRGGKKMCYRPNGHKDKEHTISIGWELKHNGMIPESAYLTNCIFGEHLLDQYPLAPVGLVESEKTAIICSIDSPDRVWLATGSINWNIDRVIALLRKRKVEIFPDEDAVDNWKEKFKSIRNFTINDICLNYRLKNGEKWAKCDLADIIVAEYQQKAKSL